MTVQQPEALRLADIVERLNVGVHSQAIAEEYTAAARELRRLHAENEELKQQIAATKPAAQAVQPFGWLITKSKLPGDVEFTKDPARENLARSCGYQTQALYEQSAAQGMEQDAARYQALVESGNFAPSPFDNGMWGLRASSAPSTKDELDAAVDRVIAAQAKQGEQA